MQDRGDQDASKLTPREWNKITKTLLELSKRFDASKPGEGREPDRTTSNRNN